MSILDAFGVQLSPCICSKARFALNLKKNCPKNYKTCSKEYWIRVVRELAKSQGIKDEKKNTKSYL